MFDFQKLRVYKKSRALNKEILAFLESKNRIDRYTKNQLKRASISIVINIAEGSGKCTKRDKKNFYFIARGSVYECVSLLEIIKDSMQISEEKYIYFFRRYETISKMLLGLIKSQE